MAHTDQAEFEQVSHVFGLTGGEMDMRDEPFLGHAYHYDGAPDYAERDMKALCEEMGLDASSMATVINFGGGYMSGPDEKITDADGVVWTRIGMFTSSGETACPGMDDDEGHSCIDPARVTAEHCDKAKMAPVQAIIDRMSQPPTPQELTETLAQIESDPNIAFPQCVLCGENFGEPHGMIYIGEGYEAVYACEPDDEGDDATERDYDPDEDRTP